MKCKKCGKEFSDGFLFCPFCGKKAVSLNPGDGCPHLYTLPFLTDDALQSFVGSLSGKSADEIRTAIMTPVSIDCYVIALEENTEWRKEYDDKWKKGWQKLELIKTPKMLLEPYCDIRATVEHRVFLKYMIPYIGRVVFRTEEEALKALCRTCYTEKNGDYYYAGEEGLKCYG